MGKAVNQKSFYRYHTLCPRHQSTVSNMQRSQLKDGKHRVISTARPFVKGIPYPASNVLHAFTTPLIEPGEYGCQRLILSIKQDAVVHETADGDRFHRLWNLKILQNDFESIENHRDGKRRGPGVVASEIPPAFHAAKYVA